MSGERDSYLVKRGEVYYYRRRVPEDVQPFVGATWWKRSLKARSLTEAKIYARALATEHDQLISVYRGAKPEARWQPLGHMLDALDDQLVAKSSDKATKAVRALTSTALAKIRRSMLAAAEQRLDTLPEEERQAVIDAGGVEAFFDRAYAAADNVEMERIRTSFRHAAGKITGREADVVAAASVAQSVHAAKDQAILAALKLPVPSSDLPDDPKNPRISVAKVQWFADRKQGDAAVNRHTVALQRFIELHGDIPVRQITKDMVKSYLKRIESLCDQRGLPTAQRGGLQDSDELPRVSAKTVDRHLISMKALLTFCIDADWLAINVATGLRPPKDTRPKASKRRPFTRAERTQLLKHVIQEDGPNSGMAWFIRLSAYTGCRIEELGQLARANVREVDGIWVIDIEDLDGRNLKTDGSVKLLPIHSAIRDEFLAWVQSGTGDLVFSEFQKQNGRYSNKLSGAVARLMDRAGLSDPRLVHHSFRHTLKREMTNARVDPDVRRAILGHAGRDAHDDYAGPSLEMIASEFDRMPALFD